jgi:hypothetical protein
MPVSSSEENLNRTVSKARNKRLTSFEVEVFKQGMGSSKAEVYASKPSSGEKGILLCIKTPN